MSILCNRNLILCFVTINTLKCNDLQGNVKIWKPDRKISVNLVNPILYCLFFSVVVITVLLLVRQHGKLILDVGTTPSGGTRSICLRIFRLFPTEQSLFNYKIFHYLNFQMGKCGLQWLSCTGLRGLICLEAMMICPSLDGLPIGRRSETGNRRADDRPLIAED